MNFDLELILVVTTFISGVVVLLDKIFSVRTEGEKNLSERKDSELSDSETSANKYKDPWYVDYSKSFFPVLLIVLILRSFVAEPFRIPSGSMMPTLLHGDFILVIKFAYGLRLPILHSKLWTNKLPQRGDVIVFRYPKNPKLDYIKRVVGLPGDKIEYRNKKIFVNGKMMDQVEIGAYIGKGRDAAMTGAQRRQEKLFAVDHEILVDDRGYLTNDVWIVPDGHYFVMGDNRDNSNDSRRWGAVPEENLVGKAFLVWMNWDISAGQFDFRRIGKQIQ